MIFGCRIQTKPCIALAYRGAFSRSITQSPDFMLSGCMVRDLPRDYTLHLLNCWEAIEYYKHELPRHLSFRPCISKPELPSHIQPLRSKASPCPPVGPQSDKPHEHELTAHKTKHLRQPCLHRKTPTRPPPLRQQRLRRPRPLRRRTQYVARVSHSRNLATSPN